MLEKFSLFRGLTDNQRTEVNRYSKLRNYRKNTVLVEKGDEGSSLYLLEDGQVRIFDSGDDDREITLNMIEPGGYFGELALLGADTRTASAITTTDCVVRVLSKPSFLELLSKNPDVAVTLMRDMALHIRELSEEVTSLATCDVYGRVVRFLKQSAEKEDDRMITPRLTQLDIANRVGSSREMVGKILGDLKKGGYLAIDGKRIVLKKQLPAKW